MRFILKTVNSVYDFFMIVITKKNFGKQFICSFVK